MSNIPRIRAPGLWVAGSVVLPEEFEAIDEIRPWMINADGGSTNAPTVQIELGGQGLRVSGPSRLDGITLGALAATGTFTVSNNSTLVVAGGVVGGLIRLDTGAVPGRIDLDGANTELRVKTGTFINVQVGGSLDVHGSSTWYGGSSLTLNAAATWTFNVGSTVNSSAFFYFSTGTWPGLSPARTWYRRSLFLAAYTYNSTRPTGQNAWKVYDPGAGDLIETRPLMTGETFLIEFDNLPNGGTLTQIEISCIGNGPGTLGMTFPQFQIIRWKGKTEETMSALINDTHVLGNWDITPITTTIPVTSNAVIDRSFRYALKVTAAFYSGAPAASGFFYDCLATGTAVEIQV